MPDPSTPPTHAPYGSLPAGGTVRPITRWGTPVMHRPQARVESFDAELETLVADMVATMYAADGVGLAACQIGVDLAVFVFDCPDESGERTVGVVCNPELDLPEGKDRRLDEDDEGCLSFPGGFVELARPDTATVTGVGPDGQPVTFTGDGLLARCLQHETDHTRGTVFGDRLPTKARKRLQKDHNFILAFGEQGHEAGQFTRPIYIVTDQGGNVYTTDDQNPWVQKFDSEGNFLTRWGGQGSDDGQFTHVTGITIDPAGNIFVADFEGNRIQKFDSEGNFILGWGGTASSELGQLRGPNALASDAAGRIYEVDRMNHRVQVFDNEGNFLLTWGSFGRNDEDFQYPSGIAVGPDNRVYVGDEGNDRIQVYELDWHDDTTQTAVPVPTPPSPTVADSPTVSFTTADGVALSGTVYGAGTTAVIFSTMGEHRQDTWAEMAQMVADQGYLAFTYDFRFWQPDGTIDDDLRDYADDDLQAAIATMREQGAEQIVLVGASLGGMATLVVADEVEPTAVIILAAPLNTTFFPTLHTTPDDVTAIHAPILFLGSEEEDFAPDLQQMFDVANEPKEIELYPGMAHGTELFATSYSTELSSRILSFIQTYAPPV